MEVKDVRLRYSFGATVPKAFGNGGKGIRTPGLLIANETLYQLSYTPIYLANTALNVTPKIPFVHRFYPLYVENVRTPEDKTSAFRKVGACLYRYRNGNYYARFKSGGKEIRCSLETTDRKLAERNLAKTKEEQSQIDRSQGKLTLVELCDRFLKTVQHQKPKTVERKTFIIGRIKSDWPTGKLTQVGKIRASDVDLWLSHAPVTLSLTRIGALFRQAARTSTGFGLK